MHLTVSDILSFDCFRDLRLVAGQGGLGREVSGCGILDYELEADLKGKYLHTNFYPGQLAVTSLLFAKSNPFLVRDAVKYLASRGGSGLIVKNVFRLPLHDVVLRYADAKEFPILLADDRQIWFEDLIVQIDRCLRAAEDLDAAEALISRLLYEKLEAAERRAAAGQLLPALQDRYMALSFLIGERVSDSLLRDLSAAVKPLLPPVHRLLRHRKGLLLLLSADELRPEDCQAAAELLAGRFRQPAAGLSLIHHSPAEMDEALRQALRAAAVHRLAQGGPEAADRVFLPYQETGVYRLLLPLIDQEALSQYAGGILEPLLEFDAENRGSLTETLLNLVRCGGDLHMLSRHTGQHENTLRNRLEKIRGLTGLSYRRPDQYEELALAARIYLLQGVEE